MKIFDLLNRKDRDKISKVFALYGKSADQYFNKLISSQTCEIILEELADLLQEYGIDENGEINKFGLAVDQMIGVVSPHNL